MEFDMAIDKGDWHYEDAGSWEAACSHIGLYLWWMAERGLARQEHDPKEIAPAPATYVIKQLDTKLWEDDLSEEGARFAQLHYQGYLGELTRIAGALEKSVYDATPHDMRDDAFAWLDKTLRAWRAST